jgi:hypothetical protein
VRLKFITTLRPTLSASVPATSEAINPVPALIDISVATLLSGMFNLLLA